MKILSGELAFIVLVGGLLAEWSEPQEVNNVPAFEVTSVKVAHGGLPKVDADPGRLTINDESIEVLIKLAYGLREYQFVGPEWLHTERYDITATTVSPQPRSVQLAMLRSLLKDRFKLAIHHELKQLRAYVLIVGKNGDKLKRIDEKLPIPFELYSNFRMVPTPGGATELHGYASLGLLSDFLSRLVDRPVLDRTGIVGSFEIRLLCAIEGFPGFENSPSVFQALQSQLGLRLEPRISQVEVTIVDHVERPMEN
jgi:uncharacterized protein (TIGR03435 family)